jgi:hypothetical protein
MDRAELLAQAISKHRLSNPAPETAQYPYYDTDATADGIEQYRQKHDARIQAMSDRANAILRIKHRLKLDETTASCIHDHPWVEDLIKVARETTDHTGKPISVTLKAWLEDGIKFSCQIASGPERYHAATLFMSTGKELTRTAIKGNKQPGPALTNILAAIKGKLATLVT